VNISSLFEQDALESAVSEGFVRSQRHPSLPLTIYGYTEKATFENRWDVVTSTCRGLILEDGGRVVARPFQKFHNYSQIVPPKYAVTSPPTAVHDKLDGSLGILFEYDDALHVATRGSFTSDQALWATDWLRSTFPDFSQPSDVTTMVEIIYPQNRIVVSYQDRAELVLLGAIDIATGADVPFWEINWWDGAVAEQYTGLGDADEIYRFATGNEKEAEEGVVATWYRPDEPSFRLKYKHPTYLSLHRLVTGTTKRSVWEALARGEDPADIEDKVDEDFLMWLRATIAGLRQQFEDIKVDAHAQFLLIAHLKENRKDFALAAMKCEQPGLMFALLDGKDITPMIWKMLKPEHEKAYFQNGPDGF
jgi:RNA ligase